MRKLTILLMMMATAAVAQDDPGGWTAAKWGMTDDQVLAALPGQATRLDPPDASARVHIKSFALAGADFHVLFQSDAGGHLRSVLLVPIGEPTQGIDYLFQSLQHLLVDKYGRPWASSEGHQNEIHWSLKTTTIILTRTKFPGIAVQILNLQYKRKDPDLDKM